MPKTSALDHSAKLPCTQFTKPVSEQILDNEGPGPPLLRSRRRRRRRQQDQSFHKSGWDNHTAHRPIHFTSPTTTTSQLLPTVWDKQHGLDYSLLGQKSTGTAPAALKITVICTASCMWASSSLLAMQWPLVSCHLSRKDCHK